jgi:hypothetical protein
MHDPTPEYRALKRSLVDAALLLSAILGVPIDQPIPFVFRERAASLVHDIETLVRDWRKRDARSRALNEQRGTVKDAG